MTLLCEHRWATMGPTHHVQMEGLQWDVHTLCTHKWTTVGPKHTMYTYIGYNEDYTHFAHRDGLQWNTPTCKPCDSCTLGVLVPSMRRLIWVHYTYSGVTFTLLVPQYTVPPRTASFTQSFKKLARFSRVFYATVSVCLWGTHPYSIHIKLVRLSANGFHSFHNSVF